MSNTKLFTFSRVVSKSSDRSASLFHNCFKKSGKHGNSSVGCLATKSSWAGPISADNVLSSPYGSVKSPENTLTEYVFEHHRKFADKPAITCGSTGRSYSFGTCYMMVNKFAMALISAMNLKPKEMVALVLPNIPEFAVVINGAMAAGLQVTFANPLYTEDELLRQFQICEVRAIITVEILMEKCLAVKSKLKNYRGTVLIGQDELEKDGVFGLKPLIMGDFKTNLPTVNINDVALVPFSSGTTGMPKGVMLTHKNLVVNLMQLVNPTFYRPNSDYATIYPMPNAGDGDLLQTKDGTYCLPGNHDTVLTVPPYFHIYGYNTILNYNLRIGNHLVSIPRFTPEEYIACLKKYKPRALFAVPSLLTFLGTHPSVTKEDLASVKHILVGAAPTTDSILEKFLQKCGKSRAEITLQQGYGMTESSPASTLSPYNSPHSKVISTGQLIPGTQARIVSLTDGKNMGSNLTGELYIKGPQVMKGYYNNPEATEEAIDKDEWLHTGDVAYYDDDHFFYIVDRTKELIKVKGNQVSPTELESIIMGMPAVADAAVVGVPDDLAGELPRAFIVLKKGESLKEKEVYDYVKEKVVKYKRLDGGIVFIDAIPRNQGGKIMRNELKVLGNKHDS